MYLNFLAHILLLNKIYEKLKEDLSKQQNKMEEDLDTLYVLEKYVKDEYDLKEKLKNQNKINWFLLILNIIGLIILIRRGLK